MTRTQTWSQRRSMDAKAGECRRSEPPGLNVTILAHYHWSVARQLTPFPPRHRNLRNLTLQQECYLTNTRAFSAFARLYNAAASPASRLRSAGSLAKSPLKVLPYKKCGDVHEKFHFLENTRFKTLEHLLKTLWNNLVEFTSTWAWNLRKVHSGIRFFT